MELVPVGLVNQIYLRCKFKGKKKIVNDLLRVSAKKIRELIPDLISLQIAAALPVQSSAALPSGCCRW
jgi:hypothetical protein